MESIKYISLDLRIFFLSVTKTRPLEKDRLMRLYTRWLNLSQNLLLDVTNLRHFFLCRYPEYQWITSREHKRKSTDPVELWSSSSLRKMQEKSCQRCTDCLSSTRCSARLVHQCIRFCSRSCSSTTRWRRMPTLRLFF